MAEALESSGGYLCAPYLHNHDTIAMKDNWLQSRNVEQLYFVTATFSGDSKPYFSSSSNYYLLVKYKNYDKIRKDIEKLKQEKTAFVFDMDERLFEREFVGPLNFVSVYYLEYGESDSDMGEVANVVAKREKVGTAGFGHMDLYCTEPPKFTFPYGDKIVVLEVSSDKSHQSVNKYCEKTRRDVCRKGITMTNLVSLSILESLK